MSLAEHRTRSRRLSLKRSNSWLPMPYDSSLKKSPSCHTLSNALDISRNTPLTSMVGLSVKKRIDFMNNTQQLKNAKITKDEARLVFCKKILIGQSTDLLFYVSNYFLINYFLTSKITFYMQNIFKGFQFNRYTMQWNIKTSPLMSNNIVFSHGNFQVPFLLVTLIFIKVNI